MKKTLPMVIAFGSILTACSSTNQTIAPLSVHEIDSNHFRAEVTVSQLGEGADSSYLRQIHRQQIGLKFFTEKLCARGVDIERPIATDFNHDSYLLNYNISCKSS